jgi:hypothetical protein
MLDNKSRYRELCKINRDIPIFSQDWWLDTVVGEGNWDVVIIERNQEIVASLPYYKTKKYIFDFIKMPIFTQCMGIWMKYPNGQKYESKLSYEKELFSLLIEKLPKFDFFVQHFHWSITNWAPFFWRGFKQSTRYTYLLKNISDLEQVFANFKESTRREIRKAEKNLKIIEDTDIEKFYLINKKSFDRQNQKMPYSFEFLKRFDEICHNKNSRKIWFAVDEKGQVHSAIYILFDAHSAYYLMGGADPELRTSGATSLLLWNAIQYASTVTQYFDFQGSMHEPIEKFFRGFGSEQKPYFEISKANGKLIQWAFFLKGAFWCLEAPIFINSNLVTI